ncbi:MAG: hypothetical protein JO022_00500 [Acidobacteriaceae bacterium]|nr:hypothetical protein [Acidobacteriaceae bacterium]
MSNHRLRNALSYLSVALLAASTLAFAQDVPPQQSTNPNGGWKRVGDSQATDPNASANYSAYSPNQAPAVNGWEQNADPQNAPAQNAPANGQPPYQQPSNPQQYPQSYPPVGYPQSGYGQGSYGTYGQQPPYGQQPNYGGQQNYPAPPPVPQSITIPQGTYVTVRINQLLTSDRDQPGDAFSSTLVDPVVVNGVVVAEPGETVGGRVALVEKHGAGHPAKLGIQLATLTLVDGQQLSITTQLTSRRGGTTPGGIEAGTIIGTTGLGAAIGAAAGWGRGAAIGAGAGALAGIIGAVVTHNHASVITPEQVLTFQIQAPVAFSTAASAAAFRYIEPGEYRQPYGNGQGGGPYLATGAAPYYGGYAYGYPYPYYAYGYGWPYYWGPSFGFYYGRGWGGHYYRGYYGGFRGGVGVRGGFRR